MADDSFIPKPTFIYKIVPASTPVPVHAQLPEALPVSDFDRSSGFIHLSTSQQLPGTLKRFFKDDELVYVLRIPYDAFEDKIRWEDPKGEVSGPRNGEGMYPHLYNGFILGNKEIERVEVLKKGETGWDEALSKASADWLVW